MKKNALFILFYFLLSGTLNAQTVAGGDFTGPTGILGNTLLSPWSKGCPYNPYTNSYYNNAEIISEGGNNMLELAGYYNANQSNPSYTYESASQVIGPMPSGNYTVTFDAKNKLINPGNPGLLFNVKVKNISGCIGHTTQQNPMELTELVTIPLGTSFNTYSVTFCIPPEHDNEFSILEFAPREQLNSAISCNGIINIDNVSMTYSTNDYDLEFDYQIDCLTGIVKVKPTTPLGPNQHDMFIIMENNPNDPNNLSDVGDSQHDAIDSWNYIADSQGWYSFQLPLDQGQNYYLKHGIWSNCLSWVELREFNIELQANEFDTSFDIDISCNSLLQNILTVTGADQQGKNPHYVFQLYKHFPGTNTPDEWMESIYWGQQSNASNYQYQQGPFSFSEILDPSISYYVKRGVWDACTPWTESRRYDINPIECNASEICDIYITPLGAPCFDGCGKSKWLSEFQINPNSTCYSVIDHVIFQTVNNSIFGPTFVDNSAPYVVPYCTSGNYYVNATIHYTNGSTSTASYFQPACTESNQKSLNAEEEVTHDQVKLYPNPTNGILNIETNIDYDELRVYSIGGKLIGSYSESTIQVAELESGTYLLKFVKDGNALRTERFVKK
jgi:hypothetical protein